MPKLMDERDYEAKYATDIQGACIPGTTVEVVREPSGRGGYRHALFDFDGTVSLIREGWPEIMGRLMVEVLVKTPDCEPEEELVARVRSFVLRTTGMQTIYQMMGLAEEVQKRGGVPEDPLKYKEVYVGRLMEHIAGRREALRRGSIDPDELLVSGARAFLENLHDRGLKLCLASGTDERYVKEEAELLGVARCFESRIYGAIDDFRAFSKALVIERILRENDVDGRCLLGFGDGYVEIDNTKAAGGTAIGVATDESSRNGVADPLKRDRLLGVGADVVVPDFRFGGELAAYLMDG